MAAGIAHEIRNPLASMSGSIQILRQELPLTEEQSQLMDIVLRESDRLNETIRSFLAYARPQRLGTTRVDVRQVITDTARLLQNNTELERGARDRRGRAAAGSVVRGGRKPDPADRLEPRDQRRAGDAERRHAAAVGGAASRTDRAGPGGVVIRVEDQGVGIAPDELDGIFQPFRGAFERGTGLGLAIVHRIVSDYGGEVHVTSQRGVGTQVEVTLPLAAPAPCGCRAVLN